MLRVANQKVGKMGSGWVCRYLGLDVVRSVVARNQQYSAHKLNWAFALMDNTQVRAALCCCCRLFYR